MLLRVFFASALAVLMQNAGADAESASTFVDGRWKGGIQMDPNSRTLEGCWSETTSVDGTTFTIAEGHDQNWYLRLSNDTWRLQPFTKYPMVALVDFYTPVQVDGEATSRRVMEIAIDQTMLLPLIENGHIIKLRSDKFKEAYDLEGIAKVIERVRTCIAYELAAAKSP